MAEMDVSSWGMPSGSSDTGALGQRLSLRVEGVVGGSGTSSRHACLVWMRSGTWQLSRGLVVIWEDLKDGIRLTDVCPVLVFVRCLLGSEMQGNGAGVGVTTVMLA